jgi:putative endopeptidase
MGALAEDTNTRIAKMIEDLGADKGTAPAKRARWPTSTPPTWTKPASKSAPGADQADAGQIAGIKDKAALVRALGGSIRADVDPLNATNFFTENLFGLWVAQGLTTRRATCLTCCRAASACRTAPTTSKTMRAWPSCAPSTSSTSPPCSNWPAWTRPTSAPRACSNSSSLAQTHATREESADIQKANNVWTLKDFAAKAPGIDWTPSSRRPACPARTASRSTTRARSPARPSCWRDADVATWRDYLAFHKLNQYASLLPKAFADQRFEFNGKALSGTPQQSARWKRAWAPPMPRWTKRSARSTSPSTSRPRTRRAVQADGGQHHRRLQPPHRQARLDGAGHPRPGPGQGEVAVRRRRLSGALEVLRRPAVVAGDAFGNALRAEEYHYQQELAKLKRKPDRTEWAMPPQLVNAVNLPLQNALNFPAAILQPPFFDPKAPDAANYGAIGSIIGHEISHSFDDQGAQFDAQGRLRDWWTKEDLEHFKTPPPSWLRSTTPTNPSRTWR